jgi:D-alanyl-D-alanine carboxypeptidase/D-alanyl-D-alanine-endopeptidase (penicillin-binding protein 4)
MFAATAFTPSFARLVHLVSLVRRARGPLPRCLPALLAVLLTAAALLPARAQLPPSPPSLPPPLLQALAENGIGADALGVVVAPAGPGPRYLEQAATRPFQPGSTMKLVTTLVALEQLGPTWRAHTRLLAAGPVRNGVLDGDLVLQGGGDMDLDWRALQDLLRRAHAHGLNEVRGRLLLDRSLWQPTRLDIGVPPFDEAPDAGYNVIPDALLVNNNLLRADIFTDERGLQLRPLMPLAGVRVTHQMTLFDGDCNRWDEGWQPPLVRPAGPGRQMDVVLRGAWPARCDTTIEFNVIERDDFIARLVRGLWTEMGGRWRGGVAEGVTPADARVLAEHASRPLSELVRAINKPSDNVLTRMLLLAIGQAAPGPVGEATLQRADRALRDWLRAKGIADAGLVLDNGSGLSRSERITPAQLEAVLRAGLSSRWAPEFVASLPIAGLDGTLRKRLQDSPAAGNARMKTGTLRNTAAIAGTLNDGAGQPLIVVAMINHETATPRQMRRVLDSLIDWAARTRFGGAATPAQPTAQPPVQQPVQPPAGAVSTAPSPA